MTAADPRPRQFELWRLVVAVLLAGLAFGCFRIASTSIQGYGTGVFPWLLIIIGLILLVAAAGLLFRRAIEWALGALLRIVSALLHLFSP